MLKYGFTAVAVLFACAAHAQSMDGTYRAPQGGVTGNSSCGTTRFGYPLEVTGGHATLQTVSQGQVQGTVSPDGTVSMQQGSANVTGRITGRQFVGRLAVGRCVFDLNYSK